MTAVFTSPTLHLICRSFEISQGWSLFFHFWLYPLPSHIPLHLISLQIIYYLAMRIPLPYFHLFLLCFLPAVATNSQPPIPTNNDILAQLTNALLTYNTSYIQQLRARFEKDRKNEYVEVFNSEIYRLKSILSEVVVSEVQIQPFLKWFQNKTHLFVTLKNSHRWDSPPCMNVKYLNCRITSKNVTYESHCLESNSNITFKIALELYQEIDIQECHKTEQSNQSCQIKLASDGVGVYSLTLKKVQPQIWTFLGKQSKHYPIWQDLTPNYEQDYKVYLSKLEVLQKARKKSSQSILSLVLAALLLLTL